MEIMLHCLIIESQLAILVRLFLRYQLDQFRVFLKRPMNKYHNGNILSAKNRVAMKILGRHVYKNRLDALVPITVLRAARDC